MRIVLLACLALLVAGCSGAPPADDAPDTGAGADRPLPVVIGEAAYQLGLPQTGPVQTAVGLGIEVPANATHLLVELTITLGSSVGLRAQGVPGCDHAYPDPQVMSEAPLVYECDSVAGAHDLLFSHQGGRIHFRVVVTASAPPPA